MDEDRYTKTVDDLRKMRAKEVVVDRVAAAGDKIIMDFDVKVDGVSIEGGQGSQQGMVLGENKFIPGFEEALTGMKKGEEKNFDVTFPKDYFKKDLANVAAKVDVTVHDVFEMELPEVNDEFAAQLNFETVALMEEELKKNINRELEEEVQHKFEQTVIEEIVAGAKFDELPDQMLTEEVDKMVFELQQDIGQRGLSFEDYLKHLDKTEESLREGFAEQAQMRLKASLVMREIAVAEDIKVEKEDIDKELAEMAEQYKDIEGMETQFDNPEYRARLENILMHKKTFETIEGFTK